MADRLETGSPTKIMKLNPTPREKSKSQKLSSRGSQESRATSTPRKVLRTISMSTEISSIAGLSEKDLSSHLESIQCSSHIDDNDDQSVLSVLRELTSSDDQDGSKLLHVPRKKIFKGKAWNFFKPKSEGTLYYQVLCEFESIEEVAFKLLDQFSTNEKKATLKVINFFVNICGFQSVKIEKYFNFDNNFSVSCEKVIKLLEFDLLDWETWGNNTYIYYEATKKKSKIGTTIAAAINQFLKFFFCHAYEHELLFAKFIHEHIIVFIYQMCQSNLRPIRHTGIKLTCNIIRILNSIFIENPMTDEETKCFSKYVQYLFETFKKGSFIPDVQLSTLRAENVGNMGLWMLQIPDIYFDDCYKLLEKLIADESMEVRSAVLIVLGNLIKSKHRHATKYMSGIVKLITGRIKDINGQVVVKAIESYTLLLYNYRGFVLGDDVYLVGELLFSRSYLYAKSAASFLVTFLQKCEFDETDQLKKLVELSTTPAFTDMKPLFIEAFSEFETILRDYNTSLEMLFIFSNKGDSYYTNNLMELIYFSVYQVLKGQCELRREHSIRRSPKHADKIKIAECFLGQVENLFEKFRTNYHVLNYVIKTLGLIDYDVLSTSYATRNVHNIIKRCRPIFFEENCDELSINICQLFHYLYDVKNVTPKETLKKFFDALFQNTSDHLRNHFLDNVFSPNAFEEYFKKIGILFEKFNMNQYLDWTLLYTNWGGMLQCKGQIVACKQFFLWSIRDLLEFVRRGDQNQTTKTSVFLKTVYSEFTHCLVQIVTTKSSKWDTKIKAFHCLCTMHTSADEMLLKEHTQEELRHFIFEHFETNICNALVTFLKSYIISNKLVTIEKRKDCVNVWLTLVLNGVADIFHIIPVFLSYYKYSEEYGELIEFAGKTIFETNKRTFFYIILTTLVQNAEEELKIKKRVVSESLDLLMLAEKFANMKEFSDSSEEIYEMIRLGLNYVFKEELFGFLAVLQYFIVKLNREHLEACKQYFRDMTPRVFQCQQYVGYFRKTLSQTKPNKAKPIKKSDSMKESSLLNSTLSKSTSQTDIPKAKK